MSGVNWAHKLKRMKETGEYQYASMVPHVNKRELIFKNCQLKQPQTKLLTVNICLLLCSHSSEGT